MKEPSGDWWTRLQAAWWPEDRIQPTEARHRYYQAKREVVERIRPAFIAEIGVRAGYSAWAMLDAAGPECRYWGIDLDEGTHGGDARAFQHAEQILAPWSPELVTGDSHDLDLLPEGIDLLHVDGDHSFEGCVSDLRLAERSGVRVILADDFHYIEAVEYATISFVAGNDAVTGFSVITDGHRGMAEIDLGAPVEASTLLT